MPAILGLILVPATLAMPFDELRPPDLMVELGTDTAPIIIDAGDLDGDGLNDLLATVLDTRQRGTTFVIGGSPAGPSVVLERPFQITSPTAGGDVNGDGFDDLAFIGEGRIIEVFAGSATGVSTEPSWTAAIDADAVFRAILGGDVNGDGYDDVVVSTSDPDTLVTFPGGPDGPTVAVSMDVSGNIEALVPAGDVNGDGYDDVYCQSSTDRRIRMGSPDGLPSGSSVEISIGCLGCEFAASFGADLDGNGFNDPVLSDANELSTVWFYWNDGGSIREAGYTSLRGSSSLFGASVSTGDLDADGWPDVVVGAPGYPLQPGQVWILPGSSAGPGLLAPLVLRGSPGAGLGAGVAVVDDLNGDGAPDLAAGARGQVWIWYGGGDTDGDGHGWASDCEPDDATIHPGVTELCDAVDNDCDGFVDEGCEPPRAARPPGFSWLLSALFGFGLFGMIRRRRPFVVLGVLLAGCPPVTKDSGDRPDDSGGPHSPWTPTEGPTYSGRVGGHAGSGLSAGDLDADGVSEILVVEWNDAVACPGGGCATASLVRLPFEGGMLADEAYASFTASSEAITRGASRLQRDMAFPGDLSGDGSPDVLLAADRWADADPSYDADAEVLFLYSGPLEGEMTRADAVAMIDPAPGTTDQAPCDPDGDGQPDLCTNGALHQGPIRGVRYAHHSRCEFLNGYVDIESGVSRIVEAADLFGEGRSSLVTIHYDVGWEDPGAETLRILGEGADPCATRTTVGIPNLFWDDMSDLPPWTVTDIVAGGDLSGDGLPDLLILGSYEGMHHLAVLTGMDSEAREAAITVSSWVAAQTEPLVADSALTADFDGDGFDDLAWATGSGWVDIIRGPLTVGAHFAQDADHHLVGDGEPVCTGSSCDPLDGFGATLAAGDFDGDGRADLVIGAPGLAPMDPGTVRIAWGGGL